MRVVRPLILLLENDDSDVFLFRRALSHEGFHGTVRVVTGVTDARAYLERRGPYRDATYFPRPDLIVCDMKLIASTGNEFLEWVRTQQAFRDIPVVMLSGSALPDERARALQLGARAFFSKSLDIHDMEKTVRQLLTHVPAGDGHHTSPVLPLHEPAPRTRAGKLMMYVAHRADELFTFERALRCMGVDHPLRFLRSAEEARCYLAGVGVYANRRVFPLPGVIVMDLDLPENSSPALLHWLRQRSELAAIPVIGLGGSLTDDEIQALYDRGMNAFFPKQVGIIETAALIAETEFLDEHRGDSSAGTHTAVS